MVSSSGIAAAAVSPAATSTGSFPARPGAAASAVYRPGGKRSKRYWPVASDSVWRSTGPLRLICAPGTTARCPSAPMLKTSPAIEPCAGLGSCAKQQANARNTRHERQRSRARHAEAGHSCLQADNMKAHKSLRPCRKQRRRSRLRRLFPVLPTQECTAPANVQTRFARRRQCLN